MLTAVVLAATIQIPQATAAIELPKSVKQNTVVKAVVTLKIPEGNHAYAPAKDLTYITVSVSVPEGAKHKLQKVEYPKGVSKTYPGLGDELALVYEGSVKIPVQIALPKSAKDKVELKLNVRVQMCSNEGGMCYPPQTIPLVGSIKVTR